MKNRWLLIVLGFSVLLNVVVGALVVYPILSNPVVTGNYLTEDINLVARIQRANFLGEVLKKQFEIDRGRSLPIVVSQLAQNPNPQLWSSSGEYVLLKMDSRSFTILTRKETEAVIAHELAHIILGHSFKGPNDPTNMKEEKEADELVVRYFGHRGLIGAIGKLSLNEEERDSRIKAIGK